MERREFLRMMGGAAGCVALSGCLSAAVRRGDVRLAADLGVLGDYIGGRVGKDGKDELRGAGLAKCFRALSAMGYRGVEFADYFDNDAKTLKSMLADNGLVPCAACVTREQLTGEKLNETCDFNLNYGNNTLVFAEAFTAADVEFFHAAATQAAKTGCRVVLRVSGRAHNAGAFAMMDPCVGLELDVSDMEDPASFYERFPHRSVTMRVRPDAAVNWTEVSSVASSDGIGWCVVTMAEKQTELTSFLGCVRSFQGIF